jgi:hypothetical protein
MLDVGHAASEEELVQIIKRYDTTGVGRLSTFAEGLREGVGDLVSVWFLIVVSCSA